MDKLILVDGYSLLFRAFYATAYTGNYMYDHNGIPTNGVFGFARMLESIMSQEAGYMAVAMDAKGPTFRSDMMAQYKAQRPSAPEELVPQFAMAREYLTARGIKWIEQAGVEGDDIIGTLAKTGEDAGLAVDIYTSDKDAFQLVSDKVTVRRTRKGVTEIEDYTPEFIREKWDIEPDQIRDLLGLMGDQADNIPGIKGVGEKTALKLLHQYGTIQGLKKHQDEIKGKMGEKVRAGMDDALLSKEIATILRDVPLDVTLEDLKKTEPDYDTLRAFYKKYDMNSFVRALEKNAQSPKNDTLTYAVVDTIPDITEPCGMCLVIYDENYHKSDVLGCALYSEDHSLFIPWDKALKDGAFIAYMSDASKPKYTYAIKSVIGAMRRYDLDVQGLDFDLALATYVLSPSVRDNLAAACEYYEYTGVRYDDDVFGKGAKKKVPETDVLAREAVSRARAVYRLRKSALSRLEDEGQKDLYENLELPVTFILADMESNGMKVDADILAKTDVEFDKRIEQLAEQIYFMAGEEFNILSPKQLGTVLFEHMGLKHGKKTKTGYSTAQDVLEKLSGESPIIDMVLEYRALTKLSGTYLKGLSEHIFPDGCVHTIFKQTLTQTGRLSSVDPNLQNIPVRTEEGKLIRGAFVPQNDYLMSFDYSQIELRILAHMAQCKHLIDAFNSDKDIHRHTAALIFGLKDDDVTSNQRRQAKTINFGIIYGMSEFRLARQVGMSVPEARGFIRRYFETYPEIEAYMTNVVKECEETGYVSTVLNRKRYIPTIKDRNFAVREQAKRFAMNAPIQGSGADIMKLAMIATDKAMKAHGFKSRMILQVHDELIFDVRKDELEELMSAVREAMEHCFKLDVPLKVEGGYADNWRDLK